MNVSYSVSERSQHPKVVTVDIRDDEVLYNHVLLAVYQVRSIAGSGKLKIRFGGRVAQFIVYENQLGVEQANRIWQYIHSLETNCDPSGMVAQNTLVRDQNKALQVELARLKALIEKSGLEEVPATTVDYSKGNPQIVAAGTMLSPKGEKERMQRETAQLAKIASLTRRVAELSDKLQDTFKKPSP